MQVNDVIQQSLDRAMTRAATSRLVCFRYGRQVGEDPSAPFLTAEIIPDKPVVFSCFNAGVDTDPTAGRRWWMTYVECSNRGFRTRSARELNLDRYEGGFVPNPSDQMPQAELPVVFEVVQASWGIPPVPWGTGKVVVKNDLHLFLTSQAFAIRSFTAEVAENAEKFEVSRKTRSSGLRPRNPLRALRPLR
jgi:hypothetical protein